MSQVPRLDGGALNIDELLGREFIKPPPRNDRVEKWLRWLGHIDTELTDLYGNRAIWRTVNKIAGDHPAMPPSHFFGFLAQAYTTTQALAVRRQTDVGGQVITLGRLLAEIAATPEILTRDRYVSMFPAGMQWRGDEEFDEFARPGGAHVDPDLVEQDRRELSKQSESIRRHVDKQLAHFEALKSDAASPTFADLDVAIDALGSTFRKYARLLTGADRPVMEPVPQYDWLAPFRIPWITD